MNSRLNNLWWFHPAWPFSLILGGTMALALWQSEASYAHYKTPKYLTLDHGWLALGAIVAFVLGCLMADRTGKQPVATSSNADQLISRWFYITVILTLFGYLAWFAVGVKNGFRPSLVYELLFTDDPGIGDYIRKELFLSIPGVTTCTQFGVAAIMLGTWLYLKRHRHVLWPSLAVVLAGTVRAVLFNERTAVLELLLPAGLVWLHHRYIGRPITARMRKALLAAPIMAPLLLVIFFGSFEYFRSWKHYQTEFTSYSEFVVWRLSGYFTTAHNNGAMSLTTELPRPLPYATLLPFWEFPGVEKSPFGYEELTGISPTVTYMNMLVDYGNIELNNTGGLFDPTLDYGLAGGLLFWLAYGFIAARLYREFRAGSFLGVTIYPLVYLSILEVPLVLILFFPRLTPALATLVLVAWLVRRASPETATQHESVSARQGYEPSC